MENNSLSHTTKQEMTQYLHWSIFIRTTASLLKSIKQGSLKTWHGLTEKLTKKHPEKSRNNTMGNLHMRRQRLQSTREKKRKRPWIKEQKYCFLQLWNLVQQRRGKSTQIYEDASSSHQSEEINTYFSCMYIIVMP